MSTFKDIRIDRDNYPSQHYEFSDHCTIAMAAVLFVLCGIGMWWCISLWPIPTLCVSLLNGAGLIGTQVFGKWEKS